MRQRHLLNLMVGQIYRSTECIPIHFVGESIDNSWLDNYTPASWSGDVIVMLATEREGPTC